MSCFYVAVDFFTEENAKKAFEFCKENFEWFVEGDGDSAGFELSGTKITDVVDSNGEGLDSDEFDALSEANWLKELSENGFEFTAKILECGSVLGKLNIANGKDGKLVWEYRNLDYIMSVGGYDVLSDGECYELCNQDEWGKSVECTLIFKSKKTGKEYKFDSSVSLECPYCVDELDEECVDLCDYALSFNGLSLMKGGKTLCADDNISCADGFSAEDADVYPYEMFDLDEEDTEVDDDWSNFELVKVIEK